MCAFLEQVCLQVRDGEGPPREGWPWGSQGDGLTWARTGTARPLHLRGGRARAQRAGRALREGGASGRAGAAGGGGLELTTQLSGAAVNNCASSAAARGAAV